MAPKKAQEPAAAAAPAAAPTAVNMGANRSGEVPGSDVVHAWHVEYAKSGRSKCQITAEVIAEGTLRIGKEIDNPHCAGKTMVVWHNMEPLFASFHKGKAAKARITDVAQLKGFNELKQKDKDRITELVAEKQAMAAELAAADSAATRLEHTKDGGVFWQISVTGSKTRTRWGPIGAEGSVTEKEHANEAAADKYVTKMIGEKLKGGYARVGGDAPAAAAGVGAPAAAADPPPAKKGRGAPKSRE